MAEVIKQDGNVNASDVRYLLHICVVFDVETTISHIIRGSQIPLHVHFDNQTFFGKRAFLPLPVQERKWEGKKGKRARRLEVKTVVKGKKENRKPAQTTVGHICSLVRGKISEGFFLPVLRCQRLSFPLSNRWHAPPFLTSSFPWTIPRCLVCNVYIHACI